MHTLPESVAKDLEYKRLIGMTNVRLVDFLLYWHREEQKGVQRNKSRRTPHAVYLDDWLYEDMETRFDILMDCLLNGYEVEKKVK